MANVVRAGGGWQTAGCEAHGGTSLRSFAELEDDPWPHAEEDTSCPGAKENRTTDSRRAPAGAVCPTAAGSTGTGMPMMRQAGNQNADQTQSMFAHLHKTLRHFKWTRAERDVCESRLPLAGPDET